MATSSAATSRPPVTPGLEASSSRATANVTENTRIQRSQAQVSDRIAGLRQQQASKIPGVTQAPLPSATQNAPAGSVPQNQTQSLARSGGNSVPVSGQRGITGAGVTSQQIAAGGVASRVIQRSPAALAASRVLRGRQTKRAQKKRDLQEATVNFFLYLPALAVAMFKDLLDFVFIGSLPVIGTVITASLSFLIFALLFLTGSKNQTSRRVIVLGLTTLVEGIFFGLNFFPLETAAVLVIYSLDRRAPKE